MTSASSFLELSLPVTRELPHSHSRLIENKGSVGIRYNQGKIKGLSSLDTTHCFYFTIFADYFSLK